MVLTNQRDDSLAGAMVQENAPMSEQHPLLLSDKAERMLELGNHDGALHAFSAALERDSALTAALAGRATCNLQLGNTKHALSSLGAHQTAFS